MREVPKTYFPQFELLVSHLSTKLPNSAIAALIGKPRETIERCQDKLGMQRSHANSRRLRRDFLHTEVPPQILLLSEPEQARLDQIWTEMRLQSGVIDRERENYLLRIMNDSVPTCVLSRILDLGPDAIGNRRRKLGLNPGSEKLHFAFLSSQTQAPYFPGLTPMEQSMLHYQWKEVREEYQAERMRQQVLARRRMIERLTFELRKLNGVVLAPCGNPRCSYLWARTAVFFDVNSQAKDGLTKHCKVCEFDRRRRPKRGKVRASPRRILPEERAHIMEIVRENSRVIPSSFFCALFAISRNDLMKIRREAGITVTTAEANILSTDWLLADTMPVVNGIFAAEFEALRWLWLVERDKYRMEQLREDEPQLALQRMDREACMTAGCEVELVPCYGAHCRGRECWPASSRFFRRFARCEAEERRCLACGDLEKRLCLSEKRKQRIKKAAIKDAG